MDGPSAIGPAEATIEDRNERLVRDYFAAVWNDGDHAALDTDAVSDGYVLHHGTDDAYTVAELPGLTGTRRFWTCETESRT